MIENVSEKDASTLSLEDSIREASNKGPGTREIVADVAIKSAQHALADRGVATAIRNGDLNALWRASRVPFLPEFLAGTKYDPAPLKEQYPVLIRARLIHGNRDAEVAVVDSRGSERAKSVMSYRPNSVPKGRIWSAEANGFYFGNRYSLVSADHHFEILFPIDESPNILISQAKIDLSVLDVPEEFAARADQVIWDDATVTNSDIDSNLVAIVSKGTASNRAAWRIVVGIAHKPSRELANAFAPKDGNVTKDMAATLLNSFITLVPAVQLDSSNNLQSTELLAASRGMSGSPVFVFLERLGKYVFAGTTWGGGALQDFNTGNVRVSIVFHGIEEFRRALAETLPRQLR